MNMTKVINDIKLSLGLQTLALPYKQPIETVLQEILQSSIRTYSHFKPYKKEAYDIASHLKSPSEIDRKMGIFLLPPALTTTPVHSAYAELASYIAQEADVNINAFTIGSPFVGYGAYGPQDIVNAQMTGAAVNKFIGATCAPFMSEWKGENKIKLINIPEKALIKFVAKVDHDLNGETIPESCVESFKQLAVLDVQMHLYNVLINMQDVGAAHKSIQLKIDRWANAEDKREQLLKEWTDNFHLDDIEELMLFIE